MENREGLLVMHRIKVPVASADGTKLEVRELQPGEWLRRSDWDRFPARSRRSLSNTGFVRDPLSVQLDPQTGEAEPLPNPKPATVVLRKPGVLIQQDRKTGELVRISDPGGIDRREQSRQGSIAEPAPIKRKRGRPRKLPQDVVIPSVPKRRGRPPKG